MRNFFSYSSVRKTGVWPGCKITPRRISEWLHNQDTAAKHSRRVLRCHPFVRIQNNI